MVKGTILEPKKGLPMLLPTRHLNSVGSGASGKMLARYASARISLGRTRGNGGAFGRNYGSNCAYRQIGKCYDDVLL